MKITKNCLIISILLVFFSSLSARADSLPTPDEVQGIINVCSAGRSVEVIGEINLSVKKLFSGEIEGEGKISDLGGIIASIEDEKLKVEVFKLYHSCIVPLITEYIQSNKDQSKESSNEEKESTKIQYIQTSHNNYKVELFRCERSSSDIFCELNITNLGGEAEVNQ